MPSLLGRARVGKVIQREIEEVRGLNCNSLTAIEAASRHGKERKAETVSFPARCPLSSTKGKDVSFDVQTHSSKLLWVSSPSSSCPRAGCVASKARTFPRRSLDNNSKIKLLSKTTVYQHKLKGKIKHLQKENKG